MSAAGAGGPEPRRRGGWLRDLCIGVRLAAAGGASAWTRLVLTAVGVGLGVALLLAAASAPAAYAAHSQRSNARDYNPTPDAVHAANAVLYQSSDTEFRGTNIHGVLLQPRGAHPPVPPGLRRLPATGTMVVSPALRRLLAAPDAGLLRARLPYRIVGTIGDDGLSGPRENAYYLGSDQLTRYGLGEQAVNRWGAPDRHEPLDPVLLMLTVVGVTILLLPVAVFVAAAVRFGAESRERQQAALRLVGADRSMTRRIAAGEALLGALLGLVAGTGFFLAGRELTRYVEVDDWDVFPTDLSPDPALAALIAVALPVAAVLITLLALRRVVAEPLGVVRRAPTRRRRILWRLVPPAAGLALLLAFGTHPSVYQVAGGVLLLLLGAAILLPWLVEAVVRRLDVGGLSWHLAVRRLALDSGSAARMVSGIAVAVAGAIALQTLLAGVEHNYVRPTNQDPGRAQLIVSGPALDSATARQRIVGTLRATPGVTGVLAYQDTLVTGPHPDNTIWEVRIADCTMLRELARLDRCADGDAFLVPGAGPGPRPGTQVRLGDGPGDGHAWRVPASARSVPSRRDPGGGRFSGILLTTSAARGTRFTEATAQAYVRVDPHRADSADQVRTAAFRFSPLTVVMTLEATTVDSRFGTIRRGLFVGAAAVLLLIGASLLVTVLEQLRERRRPLAVLMAFGARRGVLARSIVWQTAIPVFLGLVLALGTGVGLGVVLLRLSHQPAWADWTAAAAMLGVGAAVVLLVTALSLPALWRLMRPESMRTE